MTQIYGSLEHLIYGSLEHQILYQIEFDLHAFVWYHTPSSLSQEGPRRSMVTYALQPAPRRPQEAYGTIRLQASPRKAPGCVWYHTVFDIMNCRALVIHLLAPAIHQLDLILSSVDVAKPWEFTWFGDMYLVYYCGLIWCGCSQTTGIHMVC